MLSIDPDKPKARPQDGTQHLGAIIAWLLIPYHKDFRYVHRKLAKLQYVTEPKSGLNTGNAMVERNFMLGKYALSSDKRWRNSDLSKWQERGFESPAPASVKESVLNRHRFPQATWIETGTWKGHTTTALSNFGGKVFTIEPEPRLFEAAKAMFASDPNVTCVLGTSEQVFDEICTQISSGPVNFWLDGHYSGSKTFRGHTDTPVKLELESISRHLPRLVSVCVLIDDVRCFASRDARFEDYPPLDDLVYFAKENGLVWSIEHDIFIARSAWADSAT